VASLYAQPASLAFGAMAGIASAVTAAVVSRHTLIVVCASALVIIAVARVIAALRFRQDSESDGGNTHSLDLAFQIGALSFALLAGLVGSLRPSRSAMRSSTASASQRATPVVRSWP
jgi:hypothetical protein